MSTQENVKLAFESWADKKGFCLDQIFMSSAGVPVNPYEDNDTKLAFEIWLAATESVIGVVEA